MTPSIFLSTLTVHFRNNSFVDLQRQLLESPVSLPNNNIFQTIMFEPDALLRTADNYSRQLLIAGKKTKHFGYCSHSRAFLSFPSTFCVSGQAKAAEIPESSKGTWPLSMTIGRRSASARSSVSPLTHMVHMLLFRAASSTIGSSRRVEIMEYTANLKAATPSARRSSSNWIKSR